MKKAEKVWAKNVTVGTMVTPRDLWNQTTGLENNKLNQKTKVLDVYEKSGCESGIVFVVRTKGGERIELDSTWFTGIAE